MELIDIRRLYSWHYVTLSTSAQRMYNQKGTQKIRVRHHMYPGLSSLLQKLLQVLDVLLAADEDRHPLMDARRPQIQNARGYRRAQTPRLFYQHAHRICLVEQPDFPARRALRP